MYYYVYDTNLSSHKYKKALQKIETRLTDLGITGRTEQMSLLKNLKELVSDQYNNGVRNFIAVGNDNTFLELLDAVAGFNGVTLGYIPIGADNNLAKSLGILPEDLACDIISARIVKNVDIGKINHYHFLVNVKIRANLCTLICDNEYNVNPPGGNSGIEIFNLNFQCNFPDLSKSISAQDGFLNLIIQHPIAPLKSFSRIFKKNNQTVSSFPVKEVRIERGNEVKAMIDGHKAVNLPMEITIESRKLKVIVGRNRKLLL